MKNYKEKEEFASVKISGTPVIEVLVGYLIRRF